ncbi:hypothetical protein [Roseovarius sp. 2305UL8-3]|uniref:hypothetical protein n=1 Tax=Roseovarius conchicola TaxID=3121636 RepID=UPI003527D111
MFKLIRLPILCAIAFVGGMIYERANVREACTVVGGSSVNGLCIAPEVKRE